MDIISTDQYVSTLKEIIGAPPLRHSNHHRPDYHQYQPGQNKPFLHAGFLFVKNEQPAQGCNDYVKLRGGKANATPLNWFESKMPMLAIAKQKPVGIF